MISSSGLLLVFFVVRKASYDEKEVNFLLTILVAGLLVACGGAVWGIASIRCPSCKAMLWWDAVKTRGPLESFWWLLRLEACPYCGSDGSTEGGLGRQRH